MIKYFEFQEHVTFTHKIAVEVDESNEDDFDEFTDNLADEMDDESFESKDDVLYEFIKEFGDSVVNFIEDGSPNVELEAF